ncbi:MAG TPA: DNA repair protein RadA [Candidatus Methylomirabilis sp.]|nr:DNA repair protein RadA [Candidatus Methylomirabilis sp.]
MSKPKTLYQCSACGAQFLRWTGRCAECGKWSTVEEAGGGDGDARSSRTADAKPGSVRSFTSLGVDVASPRRSSGHADLDRVLAGGFVPGSVTLLGGEPGIGKSTLLAQAAIALGNAGMRVLYVTGEESPSQVALRLRRMAADMPVTLSFLDATDASVVAATIRDEKPDLTIVDSIQAMRLPDVAGESGNVTQVKASAATITEAAKSSGAPVVLAGQVTKEGDLAGPRLLEHLVDTVLMLEGDPSGRFRLLRAQKHRFGPTDEVAVLVMTERGLESVADPSAELLRDRPTHVAGSVVTCLMEGRRPVLIELQALVSHAGYGTPVRRATGIDTSRLGLLIAVLARRAGLKILDKDVYANAAGGLDAKEPATDLALCLAIASAVSDVPIDAKTVACGEVGLGGEIRPIPFPDLRTKEAARHGFSTIILPRGSKTKPVPGLTIIEAGTVREAIEKTLGGR